MADINGKKLDVSTNYAVYWHLAADIYFRFTHVKWRVTLALVLCDIWNIIQYAISDLNPDFFDRKNQKVEPGTFFIFLRIEPIFQGFGFPSIIWSVNSWEDASLFLSIQIIRKPNGFEIAGFLFITNINKTIELPQWTKTQYLYLNP